MSVADNVARVRERMAAAARRAGRNPEDIVLMAVTKTFPADSVREAFAAGLRVFGENRVQEFAGKVDSLLDLADAHWHLIGHLQTNKAAKAVELFGGIDSVDSLRLAEKLDTAAKARNRKLQVLIEVNVGGESQKTGVSADSRELEDLLHGADRLKSLEFRGLMTIPPFTENPEDARPYFIKLRKLREGIAERRWPAVDMSVLSMGMSYDFEVAIEEGSSCIRVGTAIFGQRATAGH